MAISYGDKQLETLRSLIADVDREIAATPPSPALAAAWTSMVEALAVGPAPELRTCPSCNEVGMRAASRCGKCWRDLPALPSAAVG